MSKKKFVIKFSISLSRYKENKVKMPPKPIKRSRYAEYLFSIGAGWSRE